MIDSLSIAGRLRRSHGNAQELQVREDGFPNGKRSRSEASVIAGRNPRRRQSIQTMRPRLGGREFTSTKDSKTLNIQSSSMSSNSTRDVRNSEVLDGLDAALEVETSRGEECSKDCERSPNLWFPKATLLWLSADRTTLDSGRGSRRQTRIGAG